MQIIMSVAKLTAYQTESLSIEALIMMIKYILKMLRLKLRLPLAIR